MAAPSSDPARQQQFLGEGVEHGPALVFVADEYMRYIAVNRRACEVLGYTREELLGMQVSDVAVAHEAPDLYDTMIGEGSLEGITAIRAKDGRKLTLRFFAGETELANTAFWISYGFLTE